MSEKKQPPDRTAAFAELQELCKKNNIQIVDVKFTDLPGQWQHFSIPISGFNESFFNEGFGFDGSSTRGFQTIEKSDLAILPDPTTAFIDPFTEVPTLSIIGEPMDPTGGTPEEYDNNPRYVARKAEQYIKQLGIADTMNVGPELEFFIFDDVRFGSDGYYAMYRVDSHEGYWNNDKELEQGNRGYRPRKQEGYFNVPPSDSCHDLRTEMVLELEKSGIATECHHHEVGGPAQQEIGIKYQPLLQQADQMMKYKYILKNVAARHNKTVTFMPKPIYEQAGSGMHTHLSLWKEGKSLFYDEDGPAQLSKTALYFIGGLFKHAPSFLAFGAPTTNSYKRLTPGYEAPVVLEYSTQNRSSAVRIPMYAHRPESKRVEFRSGDPAANPYLYFSAMLMAGLDGIENKIDPGVYKEIDFFELSAEEQKELKLVPASLKEALQELDKDHEYLTRGGVFNSEFINRYIKYKIAKEVDPVRLRPHPHEFYLYYDC